MDAEQIRQTLRTALEDADPDVRKAAAGALDRLEEQSDAEFLLSRLESGDLGARVQAIYGLGRMQDRRARAALRRALEDSAVEVRAAAVRVLAEHPDTTLVEQLIERLGDPEPAIRLGAVTALAGARDRRAAPCLEAMLDPAGDPELLRELLEALGAVGGGAPASVIRFLEHPSPGVRAVAVTTLAALAIPAAG